MKILINCSNLYLGGGVQVALSFIAELKNLKRMHDYHIVLSPVIDVNIEQNCFTENFHFHHIEKSPSSLMTRKEIVTKLNSLETQILPEVVFTIFGPSYWKPKTAHVVGFADGWAFNPKSVAYDQLSFLKKIRMQLHGKYKRYYLKRDADYYVVETSDAKDKLIKSTGLIENNIYVIGNTYSSIFDDENLSKKENPFYIKLPDKNVGEYRLVYIAHNHLNKNLRIINKVLPLLKKYDVKFVLTIDNDSYETMFREVKDKIINLGPVPHKSCPSIYEQSDALFAPTLLETFSASYPEAMKMNKPILTSNYSFAINTCQAAALYFDPLNPRDIAKKIDELFSSESLQKKLIEHGRQRMTEFETARSRAEKYIVLCENLSRRESPAR